MFFARVALFFIFSSLPVGAQVPDSGWHREAQHALSSDTYADFVQLKVRKWDDSLRLNYIAEQISKIRKLDRPSQQAAFEQIFMHESKRHGGLKPSAVGWEHRLPMALVLGPMLDQEIAAHLIEKTLEYEREVMRPLMEQMEHELVRDFPIQHFLCIGRDFTPFYLFLVASGKIPSKRIHNLNVSRDVKDLVNSGETKPIQKLLLQLGLSPEVLVRDGLVFLDSSMAGKIPKSVLLAILETLEDRQAADFLQKVSIRYAMSKATGIKRDLQATLREATQNWTQYSRDRVLPVLREAPNFEIQRFGLKLPQGVSWDLDHVHNLFEHRPKFVLTGTGFERTGSRWVISSEVPNTPQARILSALGLIADMATLGVFEDDRSSKRGRPVDSRAVLKAVVGGTKGLPKSIKKEIEKAREGGIESLRAWQNSEFPEARGERSRIEVRLTPEQPDPLALFVDGKLVLPLVRSISEGRNMVVYETPDGFALKVAKEPDFGRKTLLEAWGDTLLEEYGIRHSAIQWISEGGVLSLHELVRGETVEFLYGFKPGPAQQNLPARDRAEILRVRKIFLKLSEATGIFFDVKAGNFVKDESGHLIFVDRVPRLNKGYRTYYFAGKAGQSGTPLEDSEFLEEFLHHDILKKNSKKVPGGNSCDRLLVS